MALRANSGGAPTRNWAVAHPAQAAGARRSGWPGGAAVAASCHRRRPCSRCCSLGLDVRQLAPSGGFVVQRGVNGLLRGCATAPRTCRYGRQSASPACAGRCAAGSDGAPAGLQQCHRLLRSGPGRRGHVRAWAARGWGCLRGVFAGAAALADRRQGSGRRISASIQACASCISSRRTCARRWNGAANPTSTTPGIFLQRLARPAAPR